MSVSEEEAALQRALGQIQVALDALARERDEARAEALRLKLETDLLRADLASLCYASRDALNKAHDRARKTSAKVQEGGA